MRRTFTLTLDFTDSKGYIAEPYWPEMDTLVNVQKKSGMNRAKSDAARDKALNEYLKKEGHDLEWYLELEKKAKRPFHTAADGEIIIPEDIFLAFLTNAAHVLRAAQKPTKPDQVRAVFAATDFHTGKTEPDGVWSRFVRNELSNQRGLRESSYIKDFTATGTLSFDPEYVAPERVKTAIRLAGEDVGIGACRKMGWGRFTVAKFKEIKQATAA